MVQSRHGGCMSGAPCMWWEELKSSYSLIKVFQS